MYGTPHLFGYRQCDKALECYIECIRQFGDWIFKNKDPHFKLRYQCVILFV